MPKHKITSPVFPPHEHADSEGLLCYGGHLEPNLLLHAYSYGIFPWYSGKSPILWWSPPERMILKPADLKVSKSMSLLLQKDFYKITFNTAFEEVIRQCAKVRRPGQKGTWITKDMIKAYTDLHLLGFAHSAEAWYEGKLAGGLYGVSLGRVFFGESMFHIRANASKAAFIHLVRHLQTLDFDFIDCQQETAHLASLGACTVSRKKFLSLLSGALAKAEPEGPLFNNNH